MSVDGRISRFTDLIRERLSDIESITLTRRDLTKTWRAVEMACLLEGWKVDPHDSGAAAPLSGEEMMAGLMKTQRTRLSKGNAMEVQLSLEDAGIHCEPALGRLGSGASIVRIYRKWRPVNGVA
ncbi:hypothetical protein OG488_17210 [Streptomyces sp. NBC_01460]|uniref:hypothetical protein n=1 Tax=Streptomyces sp. NBC_01460 TaxID=2903875 RepID=UPI002E35D920|nr:hypothetical protein [Streptomyces sp. NBC_01460]